MQHAEMALQMAKDNGLCMSSLRAALGQKSLPTHRINQMMVTAVANREIYLNMQPINSLNQKDWSPFKR
jgi:hypothetical protein